MQALRSHGLFYLHAAKACLNMKGQNYFAYKQNAPTTLSTWRPCDNQN